MKNTKTALVAADSETIRSFLTKVLETGGYTVITAADGLEVLKLLYTTKPDCVVAYAHLPVLNGFNLSRIIKNTKKLADIAVIICVTEVSTVSQFWGDNVLCNALYVLGRDAPEQLCGLADKAVGSGRQSQCSAQTSGISDDGRSAALYGMPDAVSQNAPDAASLIELTAGAYESELFTHYVMAAAYEAGVQAFSLDGLVQRMVRCLSGVCSYHALAVIVNDDDVIEYLDVAPSLGVQETADFRQVCKADFAANAAEHREEWQTCRIAESCIIPPEEHGRLKSYEYFVLAGDDFAGTMHVASCSPDAFDERCHDRLVFFTTVFSRLLEAAVHYRRTKRAEKRTRLAFSRFVPPEIIDSLIAGDNSLGATIGEKRKVAIMIADIRNFTGISEINKPEDVVAFLNQYFTVMVNIIKKCGGSIDKFMGDAILALFGATKSYEDNGNRAARAAVEMIQALDTIDTSRIVMPEGFRFMIGIGIHYGDVIVGSIGCADKTDYTVIGDNVNLASRIESLTKQYGTPVIITGAVKDDLTGKFRTRHLDNVKVKGKSVPVSIYELKTASEDFPDEFIRNYEKAIELYEAGAWRLASKYFYNALRKCPDDRATKILLERCETYAATPPENWDGAVTLTTK
mgnify:CR=1 FL=1